MLNTATPWGHLKLDDPVLVRDRGMKFWVKRNFVEVRNDKPYDRLLGGWKKSTPSQWDECKLIDLY